MSPAGSQAGLDIKVTPEGFRQLMLQAKAFDAALARNLRRNIRNAAKTVVTKMQARVRSGSYAVDVGLRDQIARSIKVQISTAARNPGVRIVQSGAALPASKKRMGKTWESATFRHPVFGNTETWVAQSGSPYFFKTAAEGRSTITDQVVAAMQDAAKVLKGAS